MISLRSEIDSQYQWKTQDLYPSDAAWEVDYNKAYAKSKEESAWKGSVGASAQNLANVLRESDEQDYQAERLYVYAFMRYYEDTTNAKYQEMSGRAQLLTANLGQKYAFLTPEILAIPDEVMHQYLCTEEISIYQTLLNDILAKKAHYLTEREEELLALAHRATEAPKDIYSRFNNSDIQFGDITDENGNPVTLTNGRYAAFMQSADRRVRKEAFETLYRQYSGFVNTLAAVYDANVKQAIFYAKARKYASTMEMYLDASFIPTQVYTNLIAVVNRNLDKMHRYVALRKKELGVSELHFYDIYAPMVQNYQMKVSYGEAKQIVTKALAPLGEDYVRILAEGMENGWVDVYENKGKRSGAFSWGAYGTHPYVFLNYADTLNDVFTLAHEAGHAMHTYCSNAAQPHIYAGYRIFVAEVASTCNEAILMHYLLQNSKEEKERKYLLNHYLEQFKGTLFRQTMFAEFEMLTHKMAEDGQVLNAELLCQTYRDLNEKYFGPEMVQDDQIAYEWARIPHFYTPFYVYQYATGFCAAIAIASKILEGDRKALEGYKQFLAGGCSLHPIDLLKLCGVDMSKPQAIEDALKVFDGLLETF